MTGADLVAALATDVTINPITVSTDDRVLMNAVAQPAQDNLTFLLPADLMGTAADNSVLMTYVRLQGVEDQLNACDTDEAKALVSAIDAFKTSVSNSDKGAPPLATAAQFDQLSSGETWILRVAIEQVGGSAITRANIWYELGWPGSAQVSAGALVSYRLSDVRSGVVKATGFVRCMTKPVPVEDVKDTLTDSRRRTAASSCDQPT